MEIMKVDCFRSINDVKKSLHRINDLRKIKYRLELSDIIYKLVLLKEHTGLLDDEDVKLALNHVFKEFIINLKNINFYNDGQGNIVNISTNLEIYNAGFVKQEDMISAIDWLYNLIGYKKIYEREKNCESSFLSLNELYFFIASAKKYNQEHDLHASKKVEDELEKYTSIDQIIGDLNLITDLNKSSHRQLLLQIIARIIPFFEHEKYISRDVFRAISIEFSKLNSRTESSTYRDILKNNKNKKNIESLVLKEVLDEKNDPIETMKYVRCLLTTIDDSIEVKPLSVEDIINLNESAIDYFNKKINKYRILKRTTGE